MHDLGRLQSSVYVRIRAIQIGTGEYYKVIKFQIFVNLHQIEVKRLNRNFISKKKLISRMELVKTVVHRGMNFIKSVIMKKYILNLKCSFLTI